MGDPGPTGRFGDFGGRYIPETLVMACAELDQAFRDGVGRPGLPRRARSACCATTPVGRRCSTRPSGSPPSSAAPCCSSGRTSTTPGSHKINNVLGQALLAKRMGKPRLVAETGAGQHGVAAATAAALLGLECVVYMGEVDMERQALNVFRMRLLGAEVRSGHVGQPHAEGRHQRGHARLGGHRRDEPLPARLGDGPPPVPVDGARAAPRDRRRGAGAVPRAARPRPRRRHRVRRAAAPTPSGCSRASPSSPTSSWWAWSRPAARRSPTACPASCTARSRTCSRTSTGRWWRRSRSRPASTTRASVPSTPTWRRPVGPATRR